MIARVYIGHDSREAEAYRVAEKSLRAHASVPVSVTPIRLDTLQACGLLNRPIDRRGEMYDFASGARWSTEFAVSRFVVPILAQHGWAMFADCDVVFEGDVAEIFEQADERYAVQVVKHQHAPSAASKMDGQAQVSYPRKNWSSVALWNCDHPANRRLTVEAINTRRGVELHQFYWLHDSEIGPLTPACNWLVGEQPKPVRPIVAHFTNGGPWLPGWTPREHDDIWLRARDG